MISKKVKSNREMRRRIGALALALAMLMPGVPDVSAAESASVSTAAEAAVTSVIDENKVPAQLNVHVGNDAATQVNVTYTTVTDTSTVIAIQKADGGDKMYVEGSSYQGLGGKYIHEIAVSGLEPYTEYVYTVGDGFNTHGGTFKTALEKNDDTAFTFAYLADTQVSNASNAKALGATLAEVNNMNPDFVYLAGDVTDTNNNEKQWQWLFNNDGAYPAGGEAMFANSLVAVTQGNHDNNEMYQHINAPEEAGKIVYSFDYGCAKFIILNLEAARSSEDARNQQAEYLRQEVADAKENGQWTIVGFHKSLYTGASHIVDGDIISARKFWSPIFAELDVDLVLQGHDHVYSRGFVTSEGQNANPAIDEDGAIIQPDNAPLYMVGGHAGGLKWYSKKNYTVSEGDPLALNYSFLDVNSTDTGSDVKKEQVITMLEVTNEQINAVTYNFKYDTDKDQITTDKYVYDSFSVKRNLADCATSYVNGTELMVEEKGDVLEYTVSFNHIVNTNAFETALSYDESQMELIGVESCLENTIFFDTETEGGVSDVMVGVQTPFSAEEKTAVVKYTFRLKDGAEADEVTVRLKKADTVQVLENGETVNSEDVASNIMKDQASTVIYSYKKASDINKDGQVTLADLSIALLYYRTAETKCDINRDGVVNALDYVMIVSFIR
ncbi:MAG: metallophosphoesterase [Lachnospiraceae bacterium]